MCAKSDQFGHRKDPLQELLAGSSDVSVCPDAEQVAAYTDQGLSAAEHNELEHHFAACARCQGILAHLGAELPSIAPAESAQLTSPVFARTVKPSTARSNWFWWLVPTLGAAAAVLFWLALHPSSPNQPVAVETAANRAQAETKLQPQNGPSETERSRVKEGGQNTVLPTTKRRIAAAPVEPQVSQSFAGTPDQVAALPPSQTTTAAAVPARSEAASALILQTNLGRISGSVTDQTGGAVAGTTVTVTDVEHGTARTLGTDSSGQYSATNLEPGTYTVRAQAQGFQAGERQNIQLFASTNLDVNVTLVPGQQAQTVTVTEAMPAIAMSARSGGASVQSSLQELPVSGRNIGQIQSGSLTLYTFSPPDGSVTWKIGTGGTILFSADRGVTWQTQASGVTADLIAGSAANRNAAWVVGRGGVILRSPDGQHWESIPSPAGANAEWAAVAAHDAVRATVVAQDLRRFATSDGGRTWVMQQ